MNGYISREEFNKAIKEVNDNIDDIKENHLSTIYALIDSVLDKVSTLRWVFIAGMAVLGVVLGLLQVFG